MQKDNLVYVKHMTDQAERAMILARGKTRSAFDADETLQLALTYLIQTIGEAARRVSMDFQRRHETVDWKRIIGMRHKVVHDYLTVDEDVVWHVTSEELPLLAADLKRIVQTEER